jgi:hypothetical protein
MTQAAGHVKQASKRKLVVINVPGIVVAGAGFAKKSISVASEKGSFLQQAPVLTAG